MESLTPEALELWRLLEQERRESGRLRYLAAALQDDLLEAHALIAYMQERLGGLASAVVAA